MTTPVRQPAPLDGLRGLQPAICSALRLRLLEAGFTSQLVAEADAFYPGTLRGPRLPIVCWWLGKRAEPGAALARLMLYDDRLPQQQTRELLGSELFEALFGAGVLQQSDDGGVEAAFLLHPWRDELFLLADRLGAGADAVMGPGGGTDHLASLLPERPMRQALDLGCGAGSFALLAARRGAERSVGVDVNPRAVELAKFNARLNGLSAEFVVGDGTAPVADRSFDLIVSQPPFVARPPAQDAHTFLFGGARGDELPLRFVAEASRLLAPGGRAMFLLQSPERSAPGAETLMDSVRGILGETGAHVLALCGKGPSPATQASVFASFEDPTLGQGYAAAVHRYLEHFEALGVRSVTGALLVLSRPVANNDSGRYYAMALSVASAYYDSASLDLFLRGMDLAEGRAESIERACLRLSTHARITQEPSEAAGDAVQLRIRIAPPAIGTELCAGPDEQRVLAALNEAPSVSAALDTLVRAVQPVLYGGAEAVRAHLLDFVRHALRNGTLCPK